MLWFSFNAQYVYYHYIQQHWTMRQHKHQISVRQENIEKNCAKKKVPYGWLAVQMITKVNGYCGFYIDRQISIRIHFYFICIKFYTFFISESFKNTVVASNYYIDKRISKKKIRSDFLPSLFCFVWLLLLNLETFIMRNTRGRRKEEGEFCDLIAIMTYWLHFSKVLNPMVPILHLWNLWERISSEILRYLSQIFCVKSQIFPVKCGNLNKKKLYFYCSHKNVKSQKVNLWMHLLWQVFVCSCISICIW